jgi:hypothetical protein
MQLKYKSNLFLLVLPAVAILSGCKKLVEVDAPVTSLNSANVYTTDATAISVLTGIYTNMSTAGLLGGSSLNSFMDFIPELSGDELALFSGETNSGLIACYQDIQTAQTNESFWTSGYSYLYTINAAIAGLNSTKSLTPAVQQQLLGEAKFLRALHYFYLTNLYGDVPLVLSPDYTVNAGLSRTPQAQVYEQIISDLTDAESLLSENYVDATLLNITAQRVRPTKWAAMALLSRVYLYTGDYTDAKTRADTIINNSAAFQLVALDSVFYANSSEAIWQLQPVNEGWNTEAARLYIIPSTGPSYNWPVYLSNELLDSFEMNDQRRVVWVDSVIVGSTAYYFPNKYQSATLGNPVTEYEMVLRLGEQYLIRAEAQAEGAGNGTSGAISDLDTIRQRAGLPPYAGATDKTSLLSAILHERQIELFTEWGHRWLDLKRTGAINSVMSVVCPLKSPNSWQSYQQLYPILTTDITADQNLTQNPGY